MNITLVICFLFLVLCFLFLIKSLKKEKDFFHPKVFIIGYFLLQNIIYLIAISRDPMAFSQSVPYKLESSPDLAIINYLAVQGLFFFVMFLGMNIKTRRDNTIPALEINVSFYLRFFYCVLFITIITFFLFVINNGGLMAIVANWAISRTDVLSGNIEFYVVHNLSPILAGLSMFLYAKKQISRFKMVSVILFVIFANIILKGGRGDAIIIILTVLILYNYIVKKIDYKFLSRQVYLLLLIIPFFIIIPLLRNADNNEAFLEDPISFVFSENRLGSDQNSGLMGGADLSRAYIPIFIIDHFNTNNFWYGASFFHLLEAPIPRSWYPQKGPVDEGRYITQIVIGGNVAPPISLNELNSSYSWPTRTIGTWYANFGLLGVIISAFLLGKIIAVYYNKMNVTRNPIWLLLYPSFLMTFQLSNLILTNFLILFSIVMITYKGVKIFSSVRVSSN